jgi:predicted transcriptional regulator
MTYLALLSFNKQIAVDIKRDKLSIVAELLEMANSGVRKSRLYDASMSSAMLGRYLKFMVNAKLMDIVSLEDQFSVRTSDKGKEFLQLYYEITVLLKNGGDRGHVTYNRSGKSSLAHWSLR